MENKPELDRHKNHRKGGSGEVDVQRKLKMIEEPAQPRSQIKALQMALPSLLSGIKTKNSNGPFSHLI